MDQNNMDANNMNLNQQEMNGMQPQDVYTQPTGQAQNPYTDPVYQQPMSMYQQPAYQPPVESDDVSMGEWMWTTLLLIIPVVNFVLLLVWAFGGSTKPSKANFCKAQLLWMLIGFCLSIVLAILGFFLGVGLLGGYFLG